MTIAVCYLSPEGVVFGADSTSSLNTAPGGFHFFNHNQKLFELGDGGTLAMLTWGLGGLGTTSHRTLIADLAGDLEAAPASTVEEVAVRWIDRFWDAYTSALAAEIAHLKALESLQPYAPSGIPAPDTRNEQQEYFFQNMKRHLVVGFCVGGYVMPDRTPHAYSMLFEPLGSKPQAVQIPPCTYDGWGAPNPIKRLVFGADDELRADILASSHWTGTDADLAQLLAQHAWQHPMLPIRDAIDFVYACVYSTIKAMKFSNFSQICGGPIEIGVITTDRRFRWVRHKEWDVAITEGTP